MLVGSSLLEVSAVDPKLGGIFIHSNKSGREAAVCAHGPVPGSHASAKTRACPAMSSAPSHHRRKWSRRP
jgi:hypothetical protein